MIEDKYNPLHDLRICFADVCMTIKRVVDGCKCLVEIEQTTKQEASGEHAGYGERSEESSG